jgi:hypothetical protein
MPATSGIYDSSDIQPLCKIKENLSVLTSNAWNHFRVDFIEPISPGPASMVEMVVLSGATILAANATIQAMVVPALQLDQNEYVQYRFTVLDNIEAVIWEQSGQQKFATARIHCRVDRRTKFLDPHFSTTTFTIIGLNRDMQLEIRNPLGYPMPCARVVFWGFKYILMPLDLTGIPESDRAKLRAGDVDTVKKLVGPTVFAPAQGRLA